MCKMCKSASLPLKAMNKKLALDLGLTQPKRLLISDLISLSLYIFVFNKKGYISART